MRCNSLLILLWVVIVLPAVAQANGAMFPPSTQHALPPSIPSQTALIVWDEDKHEETLVVESAFGATEAGDYAWVLPVPAPPTKLEAATPGTLETLRFLVGPKIIGVHDVGVRQALFILLFCIFLCLFIVSDNPRLRSRAMDFLIVMTIFGVLAAISVGSVPMGQPVAAQALATQRVGNYETAVLRAESAEALDAWLAENQFAALAPSTRAIVDAYAAEDWVFLVSKLVATAKGIAKPHPLAVTFPTEQPVFPMRLTAAANSETEVNLYVASRKRPCSAPGFEIVFADQFEAGENWRSEEPILKSQNYYSGWRMDNLYIGHPELVTLIPGNSWLIYSQARLKPADMAQDVWIEPIGFERATTQKEVFTYRSAAGYGVSRAMLMIAFGLVFSSLLYHWNKDLGEGIAVCVVIFSLVIGGILALNVPIVRATDAQWGSMRDAMRKSRNQVQQLLNAQSTATSNREELEKYLESNGKNHLSLQPLAASDSPGNFTIREDESGRCSIWLYDEVGFPFQVYPALEK